MVLSLAQWWLTGGWRDLILHDYGWSLAISAVWMIAAVVARASRGQRKEVSVSVWWLLPVVAWALQALGAALMTTQLDLVRGASRVPFMLMYAATSVLVGLCILMVGAASTKLLTKRPLSTRTPPLLLSAAAWVGAGLAWLAVIVRELAVVPRA